MARRTLLQDTKDGILNGLRAGVRPADLATQFGVSIPTVYNYRKTLTLNTNAAPNVQTPNLVAPVVAARSTRKSTKRASR